MNVDLACWYADDWLKYPLEYPSNHIPLKSYDRICPQKIQKHCISQVINRVGKSVGQKGYELETSEFLFLSSFCSTSKITLFYVAKIMIL